MDASVTIHEIINLMKRRWKLIILSILLASLASGALSIYVLKPVYQASSQILVNQKNTNNQLDFTQLKSNIDLINTYSVIIKSPVILEKVIDQLNINESVDELNKRIVVSSQANSQVFSLTVQDLSSEKAVEITNAITNTFQKEITSIMSVNNVSVLAKAKYVKNPIPVRPNIILNIAIAILVGLFLGVGLAFLLDFVDNTLKNEQDVTQLLGTSVLGSVQYISKANRKQYEKKNKRIGSDTVAAQIEK